MSNSREFDVVVVGAGLAGHVAALTAAEAGASVCLLEKGPEFGGSSTRAGGGLIFVGTEIQRAAGVEDSEESLRADLLASGGGKARPELIDAYVDNQLETCEWMLAKGVEMTLTAQFAGAVPRAHLTGKGVATRHLHDVALEYGVTYLPNAEATRLDRNEHGRVDTVHVVIDGVGDVLTAHSGVVLTTGGFARGAEAMEAFAPKWVDAVKMSGRYNTGDGIRMARALGADLADMAYVDASFGASIEHYPDLTSDPDEEPILLYPNNDGAIIVNLEARRFGNESVNYKIFSHWCAEQTKGVAFQIFDETTFQKSDSRSMPFDYKDALERGLLKRADSLEKLAQLLRLDPATLQDTIDTFNADVVAGRDRAFGRKLVDRDSNPIGPIETAPFYGFPTCNGMTSTYAGVLTDGHMRVIDVFGAPIAGLYAAGEVVGGFHGAAYYSGSGMGKAAVFGRVAGREAASHRPPD